MATMGVNHAYLQRSTLLRDIYNQASKDLKVSSHTVWKLICPTYGDVESERLWQLTIENGSHPRTYIKSLNYFSFS